jgi:hypothetical protein
LSIEILYIYLRIAYNSSWRQLEKARARKSPPEPGLF